MKQNRGKEILRSLHFRICTQFIDSLLICVATETVLADMEEFTHKEIASVIGHPIGIVMSRLRRGRRMLRQSLKKYAMQHGYAIA